MCIMCVLLSHQHVHCACTCNSLIRCQTSDDRKRYQIICICYFIDLLVNWFVITAHDIFEY